VRTHPRMLAHWRRGKSDSVVSGGMPRYVRRIRRQFSAQEETASPLDSYGMDAPTLNGIIVPKWMCRATT
jgi:hypothetical protein